MRTSQNPIFARLFLLLLAALLVVAASGQDRSAATSHNWAVGSIQTSDLKPAQVKALLGNDALGATICDYALADLAGDGFYRLVVSIDYSGRHFCNDLRVISNDASAAQQLQVWNVEHVAAVVVKSFGREILRVPQPITDYEGAACIGVVPSFYAYSGGSLLQQNAEHVADYRALRDKFSSPTDPCQQAVADKLDRLLGDKTAGFARAQSWMRSGDASLRRKAVRVFSDIDDAPSQEALRTLALDSDAGVSNEAKVALH
jgi:hypothetical protein